METLRNLLENFDSINLFDLDNVALLNRMDTKYVFTRDQLPGFLERLSQDYLVLDIDQNRMFQYDSLYYDTSNFYLYNLHSWGRLNRYKVRSRKYVESGLEYFEIKFKNNKGRTIKNRVKIQSGVENSGEALQLLKENTPFDFDQLKAQIYVKFNRITLVNKNLKERLTIDINLTFKNSTDEQEISNIVIAELKQHKAVASSFSRMMKESHIRKGSLSKYCFGVASLFNQVRKNNFKPQILNINKILYASLAGS